MLHNVVGISCFGEDLIPSHMSAAATKPEELKQQLRQVFESDRSKREKSLRRQATDRAVGFLFKYDHHSLVADAFAEQLRSLHIKVIHLIRLSSIERYLSELDRAYGYKEFTHAVESEKLLNSVNSYESNVDTYRDALNNWNVSTYEIYYENLYENPTQWLRALVDFLHVERSEEVVAVTPYLGKAKNFSTMPPCVNRIANWHALKDAAKEHIKPRTVFYCEQDSGRNLH